MHFPSQRGFFIFSFSEDFLLKITQPNSRRCFENIRVLFVTSKSAVAKQIAEYASSKIMEEKIRLLELTLPESCLVFCPKCGIKIENTSQHLEECLKPTWNLKSLEIDKSFKFEKIKVQQCNTCQKTFANHLTLSKHRLFCDPNQLLAGFISDNRLESKIEISETSDKIATKKVKRVQCPICFKQFRPGYINNHMNIHTGNRPYKCDKCDKAFKDYTGLRFHKESHQETKKYQCDICENKGFRRLEDLNQHKLKHEGVKLHVCSFCAKSFSTSSSLKCHENRFHDPIRERLGYPCPNCQETFNSRSTLRDHEIRNHGRKGEIYKCDFQGCNKDFTNPAMLRNHSRCHSDERPFDCPYCICKFKMKYSLNAHIKRHTKIEGQFLCLECAEGFPSPEMLKDHGILHNDLILKQEPKKARVVSFSCSKCDKKFPRADLLNEHMKLHFEYQCEKCNQVFDNMIDFNNHERLMHFEMEDEMQIKVEAIRTMEDFMNDQ